MDKTLIARRFLASIALILATLSSSLQASELGPRTSAQQPKVIDTADARVIVKYKTNGQRQQILSTQASPRQWPQRAAALAQRTGLALRDGMAIDSQTQVIHGATKMSAAALAQQLATDPDIEYAVPDRRQYALAVPNDSLYAANNSAAAPAVAVGQWYLRPADNTFLSAINAEAAWDITTGLASVVVADIDTGVLFDHPDLANKLLPGRNFISTNGVSTSGWSADASDTGDFSAQDECELGGTAKPSSWHGTQTSSLIAAQTNNSLGMASVGNNIKVLPVRVLGKCGGFDSDILAAMLWAGGVSNNPVPNPTPAKVLNLSLGSSNNCSAAYVDVISRLNTAGVTVVVAAGNDEGLAVGTPANCPGVIAVAGVRHAGTKVGYSNIGPEVTLSAPAGNCGNLSLPCLYPIITATNTGTQQANPSGHTYTDSFDYAVGTSFSAPLVAGTVGLMLSANPNLTPTDIKQLLRNSARAFPTQPNSSSVPLCRTPNATPQAECYCTRTTCGAGLLDTNAAVLAALSNSAPGVAINNSPSSVQGGTPFTLAATASARHGKSIVSYRWQIDGGADIASVVGTADTPSVQLTTSALGNLLITVTVTDSSGEQASDSRSIAVVTPAPPSVTITPSASSLLAGANITFDGSKSSASGFASIARYEWSITAGSTLASFQTGTDTSRDTVTLSTPGNKNGTLSVTLKVYDNFGQTTSRTATVTILPVVPTASISASATRITLGKPITLDASNSFATTGRSISSYQWQVTEGAALATLNTTTGSLVTLNALAAGNVTVELTVTDNQGAQARSTVTITQTTAPTEITLGGGSAGGGGMMPIEWLWGLLLLWVTQRKARFFPLERRHQRNK